MIRSSKPVLIAALSMALALSVTACATAQKPSGFLGDYSKNLEPGPEGGVELRWVKPGVDFSQYDKVMLDSVVFYFAPDSEDKGIDPEVMKELSDAFHQELVDAVKDTYPIVAEPGPGVVRFKFALTGIRQSRPVLSGVSSIIPVGLAASAIKKGATGEWTGSGATGMEVLVIDSASNEVIGAGKDEQIAGFTERFSRYGSAKDAFKHWAGRLRAIMDNLHGMK
ncbi:MAG TPA: DUF3313 domain-containing protein [Deltaproteobacteria bacterium]|nr:DUF3313 domain-containing protein [Deltaproteobacteria bacterium]